MASNSNISSLLKDVVAYVDVWSSDKTANYSKPFVQQLQEMGAQVTKAFTKQVTHVIFSHGHPATWMKAKKNNVKLVSVLWVSRCYGEAVQVNEDLFPALNETNPVLKNKKHRCMQPKDSPERTPDNDKRMRRRLDKMMKDLTPVEPLFTDVSPIIINHKNGIIYSPAFKRSDYMARRLKDMKENHENISLTASQMGESPTGLKPSLGNSPTVPKHPYDQSDDDSGPSVAETGSTAESPAKEEGTSLPSIKDHQHEHLIETTEQPWISPCRQVLAKTHINPVKFPKFEENEDEKEENRQKSLRRSLRMSSKRSSTESVKNILTHTSDKSDRKTSDKKVSRRSTIKSPSSTSEEEKTLSSERRSKKGQELAKRDKSCTETKSPENMKYSASTTTDATTSLSIKTTSPSEQSESKLTSIFSALVRPPTLPCESRKTVSCSTDGDDGVFEDYFFPTLKQKAKNTSSSCLSAKTFQLPFELDSDSMKRKRRGSAVNETSVSQRKNLEQSTLQLKDLDTVDPSERLSNKEGNKLLSEVGSYSDNLKQLTKKRRPSAMTFTTICAAPTTQYRRLSLSTETTKSEENDAALELHKKTDRSLKSSVTSKGNEDTVASGLTQTAYEEQTEEKGTSLQTMVHLTKVGRTLVMTSMPTEKQGTVVQVVKALGGFTLVDEVCASTTHVVSGSHRRTLNILLGIARGCWILSFEWILWSLEKRQWIPEEPYELSDQFPAAQICRLQRHLSAGEHQQDLFQDQPAMFVSNLSQPPPLSLAELIQLCGGTVCRTVRQAGLVIGRYSGRRPEGSRVLSEQWVLDSITHLKLLPYDDYTWD